MNKPETTHTNLIVESAEYGVSVNNSNRVKYLGERCRSAIKSNPGNILEVGVYKGGTLVVLATLIRDLYPKGKVIAIDTFQGHPYTDGHSVHYLGKYSDVTRSDLLSYLESNGLNQYVEIYEGKVEEILPQIDLQRVTFAHIDCDLYRSVKFCASYLPNKMHQEGVLFFDDYYHEHCPGATRAVQEVFGNNIEPIKLDDSTSWSCEISLKSNRPTSLLELCNASVTASDGGLRLKNINLSLEQGETLAVVGPSASGKTTLLLAIAGILEVSGRAIKTDSLMSPGSTSMMFQDDILFSWMSVWKNLDNILSLFYPNPVERNLIIDQVLSDVRIDKEIARRRTPSQLSVGQRRRVSLAITIASKAKLWLLDEPTAPFDFILKEEMQVLLTDLKNKHETTIVLVTHDIEEAVYLADRVIGLKQGEITGNLRILLPAPAYRTRHSDEFLSYVSIVRSFFEDNS